MREEMYDKYKDYFSAHLSTRLTKRLFTRLDRIACKIAPLNFSTGNTQTLVRWNLDEFNPNYAREEECRKIFVTLVEDILGIIGVHQFKPRHVLSIFTNNSIKATDLLTILNTNSRIGSLELPVEYNRPLKAGGKHEVGNIFWFSPFTEIIQLRRWVGNSNIITKIQVKSYLTDRRQTGEYQTNREIRWETHPKSPQHASRSDCMIIEAKLLAQIAIFIGAPELPSEYIEIVEKSLGETYKKNSFACPISGKSIMYNEFYEKISRPVHGRSGFQVGHLNPLASTGLHIAANTSWITDLGNRVQGESSLEEITNEIFYMANFHKERLSLEWNDIEIIAKKTKN